MANLISSRQIQGVVTASKVTGDFEVSGSSHITGSFNVTGSSMFTGSFDVTGSSTLTGSLDITGSITSSGNISASQNLILSQSLTFGADSADIIGSSLVRFRGGPTGQSDYMQISQDKIQFNIDGSPVIEANGTSGAITINTSGEDYDTKILYDDGINALNVDGSHNVTKLRDYIIIGSGSANVSHNENALSVSGSQWNIGNITASGNISASGYISASTFVGNFTGTITNADTASYVSASNIDQPFTNITASGEISASSTITTTKIQFDGTTNYVEAGAVSLVSTGDDLVIRSGISGIDQGQPYISSDGGFSLLLDDGGSGTGFFNIKKDGVAPNLGTDIFYISNEGHITASGNIS